MVLPVKEAWLREKEEEKSGRSTLYNHDCTAHSIGRIWLLWILIEQAEQLQQLVLILNRTATVPARESTPCSAVHVHGSSRSRIRGSRAAKYDQSNAPVVRDLENDCTRTRTAGAVIFYAVAS